MQWSSAHIHRATTHVAHGAHFHAAEAHVHGHGLHDRLDRGDAHASDADLVEIGDDASAQTAKVFSKLLLPAGYPLLSVDGDGAQARPQSRSRDELFDPPHRTAWVRGPPGPPLG